MENAKFGDKKKIEMSTGQANQSNQQQKILILAAIPHGLRLDREISEIEDAIRRATKRDLFEIRIRTAVRSQNIRRAIAEEKPQIVHFCGHGLKDGSLLLEDEGGHNKSVSPEGLASLFRLHANYVNCVVLNACHSAKTAEAISKYINYVIGMNQPIGDQAAIAFAQGFYDGLGYAIPDNQDVFQRAFEEGKVAIGLEISNSIATRKLTAVSEGDESVEISEHLIPVLLKNPKPVSIVSNFEDKLETLSPQNDAAANNEKEPLIEVQKSPEVGEDAEPQVPLSPGDNQPQESIADRIFQVLPSKRRLRELLSRSLVVTILLMVMRYLGGLQPMELWAFDRLMRLRSSVVEEGRDRRLLVVTIDEKDIQYQNEQGMERNGSLSDRALTLLLEKLERDRAQTIGLDIYHDYEFDQANLLAQLQQNQHFFAVCKVSDPEVGTIGVAPPRGIPKESIAFSDQVIDKGSIIRRHLLSLTPPAASHCQAQLALSILLALDYLDAQGFPPRLTEGYWQVGHVILKTITSHTAGYQGIDARGHQILLNYRSVRSPQEIAHQVTLRDILNDRVNPNSVKDKIVLIGVTDPEGGDYWATPFGKENGEKIPGVFVQAHMVSQILSAVLDHRSLLWVWFPGSEVLWVWVWSLAGGTIACCSLRPRNLIIAGSTALGILLAICFGIFIGAGWVPLIPPALALVATGGVVLAETPRPRLPK